MAQTDGRGEVERFFRSHGPPRPGTASSPARAQPFYEVPQQQVDFHRFPALGRVSPSHDRHQVRAGELRHGGALAMGRDLVLIPVNHQHRALDGAEDILSLFGGDVMTHDGIDQYVSGGLQSPFHHVLDLLGGVGLVAYLLHEELHEPGIILFPIIAVPLLPAFMSLVIGEEVFRGAPLAHGPEGHGRPDHHRPFHPLRVLGRQQPGEQAAEGYSRQDGFLGTGGVQDGDGVLHDTQRAVELRALGPVGLAVAARVDGDHPVVPGQVGHLGLPMAGVDDAPGGHEENGALALAIDVIVCLHSVPFHVAFEIRVSRFHIIILSRGSLPRPFGSACRFFSRRAGWEIPLPRIRPE